MPFTRRQVLAAAVLPVAAVAAGPAYANGTTIEVTLWNKVGDAMSTNLGYGMHGDMSKATMGVAVSANKAKAGEVAFQVTNASKDTIHEMIVARLDDPSKRLPYIADQERVDEHKIHDLGEVSELDPGAHGTLVISMKPGTYLLFCNVPGHFMAGMWTLFTVTA